MLALMWMWNVAIVVTTSGLLAAMVMVGCGGGAKRSPPKRSAAAAKKKAHSQRSGKKSRSKSKSHSSSKSASKSGSKKTSSKTKKSAKKSKSQLKAAKPTESSSKSKSDKKSKSKTAALETLSSKSTKTAKDIGSQAKKVIKCEQSLDKFKCSRPVNNITVEPPILSFTDRTEAKHFTVLNPTEDRFAVKIKCSNNRNYRVSPVFGIVEPQKSLSLQVLHRESDMKVDKLVLVFAPVNAKVDEPKGVFDMVGRNDGCFPKLVVPIIPK